MWRSSGINSNIRSRYVECIHIVSPLHLPQSSPLHPPLDVGATCQLLLPSWQPHHTQKTAHQQAGQAASMQIPYPFVHCGIWSSCYPLWRRSACVMSRNSSTNFDEVKGRNMLLQTSTCPFQKCNQVPLTSQVVLPSGYRQEGKHSTNFVCYHYCCFFIFWTSSSIRVSLALFPFNLQWVLAFLSCSMSTTKPAGDVQISYSTLETSAFLSLVKSSGFIYYWVLWQLKVSVCLS